VAQIIQVNLTSENPQPIVPGMNVEFTYSVRWAPSAIPFPRRFERYLDYNFFEHQAQPLPICRLLMQTCSLHWGVKITSERIIPCSSWSLEGPPCDA
jgi:hypothetical protein